jgi:hypothetical protein
MSNESDFGSFGRYVEISVDQMSPEMNDAYEFTKRLRGLVPGPIRFGSPILGCPKRSCLPAPINRNTRP